MRTSLFATMALLGSASAEIDFMAKWKSVQKTIEAEAKDGFKGVDFMDQWRDVQKTIEAEAKVPKGDKTAPTIEQMAAAQGFKIESHQVVTEDGYILGVWRIPGKASGSEDGTKLPVLM
jgi:hypothetical protein